MVNSVSRKPSSRLFKSVVAVGILTVVAVVAVFFLWPRSPANLAHEGAQARAQLLQQWSAGEIAVLVRHTERCDQSSNPCLGPADGITRVGSEAAARVGRGLARLGLTQTDILTSPVTRTVQTAHYMFNSDPRTQEWLATCGTTLRNDVVAHKVAHRNLVLVTHSGCIADFEKQSGLKHAAKDVEYGSALFVHIDGNGQLQVLGIVNAEDWNTLLQDKN
ncbi:histidine phosphatase family protein [Pseudomonas baetica]|uniref:lipopolysaccharide core heptose(II)-phosphate phosphatase PmrG n=1 Tax=Pseudomonas baetica TaxID=674054 RepID=UPI002405C3A0|nr:histidine phosphatase family protein [Pseudomonas baetica]MDF9778604.1 broad specificity phosphatase PhoE [Pseudomonas baetica]